MGVGKKNKLYGTIYTPLHKTEKYSLLSMTRTRKHVTDQLNSVINREINPGNLRLLIHIQPDVIKMALLF